MVKTKAEMAYIERAKFLLYLTKAGLRVSKAREVVFDEVMNLHGHFTAEQLTKDCLNKRLNVSRATVYRVLGDLLEAGIIRETAFGDKHHHFEHLYGVKPHHHARCVRCHNFIEFPDRKEEVSYHPSLKELGFKILGHEMHFYGICKKCTLKPSTPAGRQLKEA